MGETVYIDSKGADGAVGFIFEGEPCQVVWTGTEAQVERRDKNTAPLLDGLAHLAGVEMLEEAVPLPFYAVPILRVFARDGRGGWFASTEEYERDSPVCHLAPDLSPRVVAPSFTAFLLRALTDPAWRSDLLPGGPWPSLPEAPAGCAELIAALKLEPEETKVLPPPPRVFPSRRDAEAVFPIRDMWELVPAARFKIRKMSPAHQDGKGYVHYQSWQETYRGLMDDRILDSLSLDRCRELAKRYPESTLVALDQANGDKVVGFACYAKEAREFITLPGASELCALYVLKEYQAAAWENGCWTNASSASPTPRWGFWFWRATGRPSASMSTWASASPAGGGQTSCTARRSRSWRWFWTGTGLPETDFIAKARG